MMRWQRYGLATFVAILLLSPGQARAGVFAIITYGDRISHVGDGGHEAARLHGSDQVGYKYGHYAFFWLDLWTWGGTYCVYEQFTRKYKPIDSAEAARLLGKNPSELGTPFWYRFPLGWFVFGPLAVMAGIAKLWQERDKRNQVALLFQDPKYQTALDIVQGEIAKQRRTTAGAPGEEPAPSRDDKTASQAAFEAGVQYLVGVGIAPEEAKRNLALMSQRKREFPGGP